MEYINKSLFIVVLGGHNPAILSHAFLIDNGLINEEIEPPVPLITPVLARLEYKKLGLIITIEPEKMQIEQKVENAEDPTIIQFTKKFYKTLEYTPIKAFGINFAGTIKFKDKDEYEKFERVFVTNRRQLGEIFGSPKMGVGFHIIYFYHDLRCTMEMLPVIPEQWICPTKLNCHLDNKAEEKSQKKSGFIDNLDYHIELYRHFNDAIIKLAGG